MKHRVNEILKMSGKGDWRYCPSREKPADIGSRGMTALDLKQCLVVEGSFLVGGVGG